MPPETVYQGPKGDLVWSEEDCHDCSGCVAVCPFHALEIRSGLILADMERCTLCSMCVRICPTEAFRIDRRPRGGVETHAPAP